MHILGSSEVERLSRYKGKRYREFLQSRLLLRRALSETLPNALAPDQWQVTERAEQVCLVHQATDAGWHYSLSHSRGMIALAISNSGPCGIDLEHHRQRANITELAHDWFHQSETQLLKSLTGSERTNTFYRLWTMKEAFIKAVGSSVFSGAMARTHFVAVTPEGRTRDLCAHTIDLQGEPFSLAVVSRDPPTNIAHGYPLATTETITPYVTTYTIRED